MEAPAGQEQGKVAPEATGEQLAEPMGAPEEKKKNFTVTVRPLGSSEEGTLVGEYDTLYAAMENCKENDLLNEYVITLNKDYDIPETEGVCDRQQVNILLKSAEGKTCTLKRFGDQLVFYVRAECKMRTENIILDGNKDGELTFLSKNGELTLGNGTVVQNFIDVPAADGPAIYLTESSTLNIEDGVIVRENKGNKQGGVIGDNSNETKINISGGLFENNAFNNAFSTYGGVLATYGTLNITGGIFRKNSAEYGGAICVFKGSINIKNATFEENTALKGGAIEAYHTGDFLIEDETILPCDTNNATIEGCTFSNNGVDDDSDSTRSTRSGGALFVGASKNVSIKNNKFIKNTAEDELHP